MHQEGFVSTTSLFLFIRHGLALYSLAGLGLAGRKRPPLDLTKDTRHSYLSFWSFTLTCIQRSSITINTAPLTTLHSLTDTTVLVLVLQLYIFILRVDDSLD